MFLAVGFDRDGRQCLGIGATPPLAYADLCLFIPEEEQKRTPIWFQGNPIEVSSHWETKELKEMPSF